MALTAEQENHWLAVVDLVVERFPVGRGGDHQRGEAARAQLGVPAGQRLLAGNQDHWQGKE